MSTLSRLISVDVYVGPPDSFSPSFSVFTEVFSISATFVQIGRKSAGPTIGGKAAPPWPPGGQQLAKKKKNHNICVAPRADEMTADGDKEDNRLDKRKWQAASIRWTKS